MTTADEAEDSDVNVSVGEVTELDVKPDELVYSGDPGEFNTTDASGFEAIELANIGSEEINQISARATMPDENPFGSGDSDAYNTGNFIKMWTDSAANVSFASDLDVSDSSNDISPHYLNRVEYREEDVPSYIQTLEDSEGVVDEDDVSELGSNGAADVGRFRAGDVEYFYVLYHEDSGSNTCSGSDSELWVGTDGHTSTELGTFDFTDDSAEDVEAYDIADGGAFGVVDTTVEVGDEEYTVHTYCDEDNRNDGHTIRTRFNVEVTSPVTDVGDQDENTQDNGPSRYILDSDSAALQPGASFPLDVGIEIPFGVAEGEIDQGTMTIEAANTE